MNFALSAEELDRVLSHSGGSKDVIVIDTRTIQEYLNGHIPMAVNLDLMQFHWIDTTRAGITQFNRQMKVLLSNIGLANTRSAVFYDNISGPAAARGVWLSHYFSLQKVSILDGGFETWKGKGFRIENDTRAFSHSRSLKNINSAVIADLMRVKTVVDKKSEKCVLLDCRSEDEFSGRVIRASKGGHIPGAINRDWVLNIDIENHGRFRSMSDLAKIYSIIPKSDEIITYCQGGYRAANTFLVLKMLGYKKVRMYLGSWGEWGNRPGLEVE